MMMITLTRRKDSIASTKRILPYFILPSKYPTPKSTLLYSNMQSLIGFLVIPKYVTLNDLWTWFNVFCAGFGTRCFRIEKFAVFSVYKRSICGPWSSCSLLMVTIRKDQIGPSDRTLPYTGLPYPTFGASSSWVRAVVSRLGSALTKRSRRSRTPLRQDVKRTLLVKITDAF